MTIRGRGRSLLLAAVLLASRGESNIEPGPRERWTEAEADVGAHDWGMVRGRSQTIYSWGSWFTMDPSDAMLNPSGARLAAAGDT